MHGVGCSIFLFFLSPPHGRRAIAPRMPAAARAQGTAGTAGRAAMAAPTMRRSARKIGLGQDRVMPAA
ncbi:hypothetical protein COO09_16135 [Rhizorhabdus dicambivorans]|uniref:Uncharacterized protein n=1 Tax=Rhizorhabdus dicambivorans TaxID=1850238 RepID=A0A2A4FR26_9SPHN|nr:hypothetical protein COO09_16135 [Rhizorhabdus dicambivorans]